MREGFKRTVRNYIEELEKKMKDDAYTAGRMMFLARWKQAVEDGIIGLDDDIVEASEKVAQAIREGLIA